jgi:hypothetical protein
MLKKSMLVALLAAAAIGFALPADAASRTAKVVHVETSVYALKDNNLFKTVAGTIGNIPGATMVFEGQSEDGPAAAIQAWTVDTGSANGKLLKALSAFDTSSVTSTSAASPVGRMIPLEIGTERDYVRAISFRSDKNGVKRPVVETGTVPTGYKLHTTASIRKDGIHLALEQRVSKLTGPDDGFRNYKTQGGVIQLKQVSERAIKFKDIHMPGNDKSLVLLVEDDTKNEFLVTVVDAKEIR